MKQKLREAESDLERFKKQGDNYVKSRNQNTESFVMEINKEYLEKSYKRDLVTTLTSFKKNGVFLTGLKEEREVTDLNDVTKYTASYIDIDGKKSTVKLTIPNVRRDGKILLDGVPQILRKQHRRQP